jgi:hypothetical protein
MEVFISARGHGTLASLCAMFGDAIDAADAVSIRRAEVHDFDVKRFDKANMDDCGRHESQE